MANFSIFEKIISGMSAANLDAKYGPYESEAAAVNALGENGRDCITDGLTVGIRKNGRVIEYWFQGGELIEKQNGGGYFEGDNYIVTNGDDSYLVSTTKIVAPTASITTTTFDVVTGTLNVPVQMTSGATLKYKVTTTGIPFPSNYTTATGSFVPIATGYTNQAYNPEKQYGVMIYAEKDGLTSAEATYTITVRPKVAAGSVTFTRWSQEPDTDTDDYATNATIILSKSPTASATNTYTEDGGATWSPLNDNITRTANVTKSEGTYQVKATYTSAGYQDSDIAENSAIVLNKKKFYYGVGNASLGSEAAIKSLAGGGSVKKNTMAGTYNVTVSPENVGKYLWFCGSGTLTKVTSGGFEVPMNSVTTVAGYNCYRSASAITVDNTYTFVVE